MQENADQIQNATYQNFIQNFGFNAHAKRKAKKLRQGEMAERLNVSQSYLSMIEAGKTGNSMQVILNICDILENRQLGISYNEFKENAGFKLMCLRRQKKLKQGQVSKQMQMSQSHFSMLENNKAEISLLSLCKICDVLETNIETIVPAFGNILAPL